MLRVRQPAIKSAVVVSNLKVILLTQRKQTMQLRQNTSATVRIGPILDSAGAAVTSAVVGDLRITKNGAVAVLSGITITHDHNGNYLVPLTSTHTDTVGRIDISVGNTAMQMVPERFMVLEQSLYDDLVVTSPSDAGGLRDVSRIAGQPTSAAGAVTFPGTIASTTNITQATGITVQTNNDKTDYTISSAGIASFWSALTTGFTTVGSIGKLFVDTLDATISSRSTYAGTDTPGTSQLLGRLTAPRATNLDFLDAAISTVLSTINGLNNLSALANIYGASSLEIPDTGSTDYAFTIVVRDNEGKLVNLDTTPTVTAANAAGTSRSANLSAVSNPSTGRYIFTYSVASTHPPESLRIMGSGTVSGEARYVEWVGNIVNYDTLTTLQAVQTTVNAIDTRLPAALVNGRIVSYVGEMAPNVITAGSIATSALNGKGDWALASNWTAVRAGYLDLVLLANNTNQRTITITGNGHVPSVLHDAGPNSIPEDAFQDNSFTSRILASDAVTEIVTGIWSANLSGYGANTAGKNLFDVLANTATLVTRIPATTAQLVTDLALMLVGSGTALVKWTATALSLAPAGGGGGGGSVTVTPEAFINLDNTLLEKNVFTFFNNESRTYLVTLASGVFDGLPMTFCIEKADKTTLVVVTGLTSTTNSVYVAVPSVAEQTDKCMQWSLRDSATGRIILYGPAVQKYAAFN